MSLSQLTVPGVLTGYVHLDGATCHSALMQFTQAANIPSDITLGFTCSSITYSPLSVLRTHCVKHTDIAPVPYTYNAEECEAVVFMCVYLP